MDKVTCNSDFAEPANKSPNFAFIFISQAVPGELEGFRERNWVFAEDSTRRIERSSKLLLEKLASFSDALGLVL